MLDFKKIQLGSKDTPSDKIWIDSILKISDFRATEYCTTSLYIWDDVYNSAVCRLDDFLLVRSQDKESAYYIFPAGKGDLRMAIEAMMEDAGTLGKRFVLGSISPAQVPVVEGMFPGQFEFSSNRNSFDYIYSREHLSTLAGRKYQSKRNFAARFRKLEGWKYESILPQAPEFSKQIDECIEMTEIWCRQNGCTQNISMQTESCATHKALHHFKELELKGGLLRLNGKVVAYTVGEKINSDTFIVHIEKAFSDIKGAYQVINQEFILHEAMECAYINREDDAGDQGLRTAKLSYHPIFMEEKFGALKK